ncbi:MAG: DUF2752 domain-containing protein [Phycisphaerae bacterium]|jgi:hypothetical protein
MNSRCSSQAVAQTPAGAKTFSIKVRLRGAIILIVAAGTLLIGASLRPAPSGMGTAEQLGLPPCSWPIRTGWPCPTCGMTTSIAALAHGRVLDALAAHPFGPVLFVGLVIAAVVGGMELVTGKRAAGRLKLSWPLVAIGVGGLLLGWGIKIAIGVARGEFPIR